MCHEQNDINGWTMSIVDWQTKEPFNYTTYEVHSSSITDTKDEMEDLCLLLNELADENEELKQRNNRQYEQLGRLYDLIEQKEWRALTDIIDDFKKSDEQLQKEWGTYGDV